MIWKTKNDKLVRLLFVTGHITHDDLASYKAFGKEYSTEEYLIDYLKIDAAVVKGAKKGILKNPTITELLNRESLSRKDCEAVRLLLQDFIDSEKRSLLQKLHLADDKDIPATGRIILLLLLLLLLAGLVIWLLR